MFKEDPEVFYAFTGFYLVDFDMLHDVVKDCLEQHGRGRNPKNGLKKILFLLLYYVRRYLQYESVRAFSRIPESTFKGILENYIPKITSRLVSKFIIYIYMIKDVDLGNLKYKTLKLRKIYEILFTKYF